jgi:hypothetical protein
MHFRSTKPLTLWNPKYKVTMEKKTSMIHIKIKIQKQG